MAKYRHRTFEMFDFQDEATLALASKSARRDLQSDEPELRTLQQLTALHLGSVAHVKFKSTYDESEDALRELREDFAELADSLVNNSGVLLDFEGVEEFSADSIEALAALHRKLLSKGSRVALCKLAPEVQAAFFPHRKANEQR